MGAQSQSAYEAAADYLAVNLLRDQETAAQIDELAFTAKQLEFIRWVAQTSMRDGITTGLVLNSDTPLPVGETFDEDLDFERALQQADTTGFHRGYLQCYDDMRQT